MTCFGSVFMEAALPDKNKFHVGIHIGAQFLCVFGKTLTMRFLAAFIILVIHNRLANELYRPGFRIAVKDREAGTVHAQIRTE